MIYVYAITDAAEIDDGLTGLHDAPTETLECEGIGGVFSSHDQLEVPSDPELLWAHERVVDHLMEHGAVLPLRFGTVLNDPGGASRRPRQGRRALSAAPLAGAGMRGAGRFGWVPTSSEPAVVAGGADYMRERLAVRQQEEDAADRVLAPLRPLARATARRPVQAGNTTVSESYLVPRGGRALRRRGQGFAGAKPRPSISCTDCGGPTRSWMEAGGEFRSSRRAAGRQRFPERRPLDGALSRRINADPEGVERASPAVLRSSSSSQLMERQASIGALAL